MKLRMELITFFDHYSEDNGWVTIDDECGEDFEALKAQSVGWVIAENDRFLKLAANLDGNPEDAENCFGIFTLCKADIIKRVELKP